MLVEVGAIAFLGSPVYAFLTKLAICGKTKTTKALKLLADMPKQFPLGMEQKEGEVDSLRPKTLYLS